MNTDQVTALGGTLIRWEKNTWAWKDHTPAPEVQDASPSWYYNFRIESGFVEVPVKMANSPDEPELAWCRAFSRALSNDHKGDRVLHEDGRRTNRSATGKAIPEVYLVPVAQWDEWNEITVIGPKWDRQHEVAIMAKATRLRQP